MSRFDDAARVSRQKSSCTGKQENLPFIENNGPNNHREHSLVQSRKSVKIPDLDRDEVQTRGNLIQSRKSKAGGIDPSFLGIAVKSQRSNRTQTGNRTLKPQTGQTYYTEEDDEFDENYPPGEENYDDDNNDDDDDDDDEEYPSEYLYFLAQQQQQKASSGPRVQIEGGPEPCSCFPQRSSNDVPSMVYEKVKCKHSQLNGEAHAGVYRFHCNWNEYFEYPKRKRKNYPPPKTKFVFGYPKPSFIDIPDSAETGEEFYDGEEYEGDEYWDYYKDEDNFPEPPDPSPDTETQYEDEDPYDEYDIKRTRSFRSRKEKTKKQPKSDNLLTSIRLPHIGYSPPPSRERSSLSVRSQPYSLPPLPESPYISAKPDAQLMISSRSDAGYNTFDAESRLQSKHKRRSAPVSKLKGNRRTLETPRRFKGRYYDSELKHAIATIMSTFNDAVTVHRQNSRTSAKLQNTQSYLPSLDQGRVNIIQSKTGPEVNEPGIQSRQKSLIHFRTKSNGSGSKPIGNKLERLGVDSRGNKINIDIRGSVLGSRQIRSQRGSNFYSNVGNLSYTKGGLIQNRNDNKGGIDPSYFGMSVKPKTVSVKPITARTRRLQTSGTFNDDNDHDGYQPEDEFENYNEEEDDDEAYPPEYLEFIAQQRQHKEPPEGPRVEIYGGAEPCSCFPHRSDKNLPSMVYEKLKCKHSNVKGEAHAGVYKFESNWNEQYEDSAKKKNPQPPPKTKFVFGYPKPTFLELPETAETYDVDEFYEGEEYEGDKYWDYYQNDNVEDDTGRISDGYTERQDDDGDVRQQSRKANKDKKTKADDFVSGFLPQIGYSPPPSRDRSRLSVRSRPYSLPALPDSPYLSAKSVKRIKSVQSIHTGGDYANGTEYDSNLGSGEKQYATTPTSMGKVPMRSLETPRRFKGKYYDSVLNKTLNYDIMPKYQKDTNEWRAYVGEGTAGSRRGSRESRMPSKGFNASGSRRRSVQIPEEDDADDNYYEDDEDSG